LSVLQTKQAPADDRRALAEAEPMGVQNVPCAPTQDLGRLALAAIGVVYGDIGTSPLYTLKECFGEAHGIAITPPNVLGLLSLVLWSLILVVTVKYVLFIMRADNRGEGGILALMALAERADRRHAWFVIGAGLFGASLFFGDGIITPAISVLSAVEGLTIATPAFKPFIVPLALAVLVGLFTFQRHGTEKVGAWFGPVMALWFTTLAILGAIQIARNPVVLAAIHPRHAIDFFAHNGFTGFSALGGVVLAITGAEALYADMGHFGARPVRVAWLGFVFPALALNYMGQSALVLETPEAAHNPFYLLAPDWLLLPLVGLATAATVIASQAVISGAYSLTQQAIQLGFWPREPIHHTSERQMGQIYMPVTNTRLLIGVITLVLLFRSSSALANAYGIAVTATMVTTSLLAFVVIRERWRWSLTRSVAVIGAMMIIDLAFFGANLLKVFSGGWVPLLFAIALCLTMTTWRRGREAVARTLREGSLPTEIFLKRLDEKQPTRVPGTAVYLTGDSEMLPNALLHNLKHNKVLHERVVFLTVRTLGIPRVPRQDRLRIEWLRRDFLKITIFYGFMQTPNVPRALALAERYGVKFDKMDTSFFVGRETLVPSIEPTLKGWRETLFVILSKNASSATEFFCIPTYRVVELGAQVPI
jgi:KUP system potassium uptake protein